MKVEGDDMGPEVNGTGGPGKIKPSPRGTIKRQKGGG